MIIDEVRLRQVLGDRQDQTAPPSTVNLAGALAAGGRKLRRRRIAWATGSALALCAVTVAAVPVADWLRYPTKPGASQATGPGARAFSPLGQYAYFARLPNGARHAGVSISRSAVTQWVAEGAHLVLELTA